MNKNLAELLLPSHGIDYSKLKPEQAICVEFANTLRQLTLENKLSYVWFHVPNEFLPSLKLNYSFERKQKHMGKICGVPDYCFLSQQDCFFIEFKAGSRKQSPYQIIFEEWCTSKNVPYFLCRTPSEGIKVVMDRLKIINQS